MRHIDRLLRSGGIGALFLLLISIGTIVQAQGRMTIHAAVQGTGTQLGQMYDVHIHIEQFSTPVDQKALIDAFAHSGQDGFVQVLENMKPKGNVRFTNGGLGNDVKYIIELPPEKGRRIRLVTDRNIGVGEQFRGTRSKDYSVGVIDLVLPPNGKEASAGSCRHAS
jgi:cell division protein FtsI/penicillin-binding protein 2